MWECGIRQNDNMVHADGLGVIMTQKAPSGDVGQGMRFLASPLTNCTLCMSSTPPNTPRSIPQRNHMTRSRQIILLRLLTSQ